MIRRILISDLHIDTWTDRKIGYAKKSKKEHLMDFLDWCEEQDVGELIINGDIMDLPPYIGHPLVPEQPGAVKDVMLRLIDFMQKIPITYIFGNHDIGISGLRNIGVTDLPQLENIKFAYPDYVVDDYPAVTVMVGHGHIVDPLLALYVRNLKNLVFQDNNFERFQWAMQRRNVENPEKRTTPGVLPPVAVRKGQKPMDAVREGQKSLLEGTALAKLAKMVKISKKAAFEQTKAEWWWYSAIEDVKEHIKAAREQGKRVKPIIYRVFGHTHRADFREHVTVDGQTSAVYINAGTWTEGADQGWYLDIDENGKVELKDWISEPEEDRLLSSKYLLETHS